MLEYIIFAAAGGLFARCVFWHVPKLALMIYRGMSDQPLPRGMVWQAPPPAVDHDALELALFRECPSAFWLNPARYDYEFDDMRWLTDMRYLPQPKRRITSVRRFDRHQGSGPPPVPHYVGRIR